MAEALEELLESHRGFAPRLSEDRLIQIIKERRAELAVPSNIRPEWKESILDVYVTEAQDRGMYVGNPSLRERLSRRGTPSALDARQAKGLIKIARGMSTKKLFEALRKRYAEESPSAESKAWIQILEAEIQRRGLGPQLKHYRVPAGRLASFIKSPEDNPKPRKKKAKKKRAKKKTLKTRVEKAAKKGEKAAKRGAKRAKKFAGTEEGYMTGGAMTGALLAGPIGAGLGLVAGKRLYKENPDGSRRLVSGRVPRSLSKTVYKREANKHAIESRGHYSRWEQEQDPEALIQALRSTVLSEQYYKHAGISGSAKTFGSDPAAAQYDSLRSQIMEILAE